MDTAKAWYILANISSVMSICGAIVTVSLAKVLPRGEKRLADDLARMIVAFNHSAQKTPDDLWDIYGRSQSIIEQVKNFQEQQRWRM